MLVRFVVENVYSFGERKEFNMIPRPRLNTLKHHKYNVCNIDLLKMTSVYGANAAGKSNLVKAIDLLQDFVREENTIRALRDNQFKFQKDNSNAPQLFAIEFIQTGIPFLYAIEIMDGRVATEELFVSGIGKKDDLLLFERKTDEKGKTTLLFSSEFENNGESKTFKNVLLNSFIKPNKPAFKLISENGDQYLPMVKSAFSWFVETLKIVTPNSRPIALIHDLDEDNEYKKYAEQSLNLLNIGVKSLKTIKSDLNSVSSEIEINDLDIMLDGINNDPSMIYSVRYNNHDYVLMKEDEKIVVKQLQLEHVGKDNFSALFNMEEESDGTIRLLDFVPVFHETALAKKVYIIDEIERSIHPLLIKELVSKFSKDEQTNGQLIFTTHESNLLDQEIFRQDEIWFAEKDETGSTDLYSLSDFKEHKTIDIRKGYLNGRYGSIPFLANLKDLNWHTHATTT
jgi:uncharacterized protein